MPKYPSTWLRSVSFKMGQAISMRLSMLRVMRSALDRYSLQSSRGPKP